MGVKVNQSPDDQGGGEWGRLPQKRCPLSSFPNGQSRRGHLPARSREWRGGNNTPGVPGTCWALTPTSLEDGVFPDSLVAEAWVLVANLTTSKT